MFLLLLHLITGVSTSLFVVDSTSGAISLSGTLDFETSQQHSITVHASDGELMVIICLKIILYFSGSHSSRA